MYSAYYFRCRFVVCLKEFLVSRHLWFEEKQQEALRLLQVLYKVHAQDFTGAKFPDALLLLREPKEGQTSGTQKKITLVLLGFSIADFCVFLPCVFFFIWEKSFRLADHCWIATVFSAILTDSHACVWSSTSCFDV